MNKKRRGRIHPKSPDAPDPMDGFQLSELLLSFGASAGGSMLEILPKGLKALRFLSPWGMAERMTLSVHDLAGEEESLVAFPDQVKQAFSEAHKIESPSTSAIEALSAVPGSLGSFDFIYSLSLLSVKITTIRSFLQEAESRIRDRGVVLLYLQVAGSKEKDSNTRHYSSSIEAVAEEAGLVAHFLPMMHSGVWEGRAFVAFRRY